MSNEIWFLPITHNPLLITKHYSSPVLMCLLYAVETGQGNTAAHTEIYLPLLPSGPDGVRKSVSHRPQPHSQLHTKDSDGFVKSSICGVALHPSSLRRTNKVRLIPQDLRALHLKLFTKPSDFLAERVGFEPTVPLPVHMRSRHAPSAAWVPLRSNV